MSKKVLVGLGVAVILFAVVGVAAYVLRPDAEASAPIEAVPVVVAQPEIEKTDPGEKQTDQTEGMEDKSEESLAAADGVLIFTIVPAESEVRFTLDELLGGVPTTVVGATDQVAGEIAIDPANPESAQVGVILINARTFVTDSNFRNRAINNEILETDEYEYVQFTPVAITGFPENPAIGERLEFQMTGDLTIRDITQEVTFAVIVTVVSETRLEGAASALISRADYDLQIPEVPRVADVDEEVLLEIDFVAVRK